MGLNLALTGAVRDEVVGQKLGSLSIGLDSSIERNQVSCKIYKSLDGMNIESPVELLDPSCPIVVIKIFVMKVQEAGVCRNFASLSEWSLGQAFVRVICFSISFKNTLLS